MAVMRAALRPVLVQVPCVAARVSPAACPWRLLSRPCVPSPAVGVPDRATILSAESGGAAAPLLAAAPAPATTCAGKPLIVTVTVIG